MTYPPKTRKRAVTTYVDEVSEEPVVISVGDGYTAVFSEFCDEIHADLYKNGVYVFSHNISVEDVEGVVLLRWFLSNWAREMIYNYEKELPSFIKRWAHVRQESGKESE